MARVLIIIFIALSIVSCKEEKKWRIEVENAEGGVVEGDLTKMHIYHGGKELFEDVSLLSRDPSIATARITPDDIKEVHRGYYLLAHAPGTTTIRAVKDGREVATYEVLIVEQ